MENCLKIYNEKQLMETCISDYCDCKNTYERTQCICNGFSALARDCQFNGIMLADGWRDWQICRKLQQNSNNNNKNPTKSKLNKMSIF